MSRPITRKFQKTSVPRKKYTEKSQPGDVHLFCTSNDWQRTFKMFCKVLSVSNHRQVLGRKLCCQSLPYIADNAVLNSLIFGLLLILLLDSDFVTLKVLGTGTGGLNEAKKLMPADIVRWSWEMPLLCGLWLCPWRLEQLFQALVSSNLKFWLGQKKHTWPPIALLSARNESEKSFLGSKWNIRDKFPNDMCFRCFHWNNMRADYE